jgi:hypothetical protein
VDRQSEETIMSDSVQRLVASFEALSDEDKELAVSQILCRLPYEGDIPEAGLHAAADELFAALDAEEASRAADV